MTIPSRAPLDRGALAEERGDFLDATAAFRTAVDDPDPLIVAEAHFRLGRVAWRQGRYDEALAAYETARTLADRSGGGEIVAQAENGIGAVHYARGAYAQARAAYGVALERSPDPILRAKILLNLGVIANIEGDLESARTLYARSHTAFEQANHGAGRALALHNIGMLHADLGEWDEADEAYRLCLGLCEEQGNRQMIANVLVNQSELFCARGWFDRAVANCDLALDMYGRIGDEVGRGEALRWQGHALRHLAHAEHAERVLTAAIRIARRGKVKLLEAEATRDLAAAIALRGDRAAARKRLTHALAMFDQLGAKRESAEVREELARLA